MHHIFLETNPSRMGTRDSQNSTPGRPKRPMVARDQSSFLVRTEELRERHGIPHLSLSLPLYRLIILAVAVASSLPRFVIFCNLSLSLNSTKSPPSSIPLKSLSDYSPCPIFVFLLRVLSLSLSLCLSRGSLTWHLLGGSWRDGDRASESPNRMESSGASSFLRNRNLESFLNASSIDTFGVSSKALAKEEVGYRPRTDGYVDEDGWFSELISWIRIVTCFLSMLVTTFIWALIMVVLIPWPYERIRQGNIYGHVTGRLLMWILGNPIKFEGLEYADEKAIYICNHASPIDIFLIMWLTPTGTVGIAKKEIIWYPLFGQLYVLANHLRIDRSNPTAAIKSMREAAHAVVKSNLSLIIFPEGTRSKNGRLLPFKKGFVHLALQSRRPVVPVVLTGTHLAWRKGSLHVRPAPLTVKFLPPIKTDEWTADHIDEYVEMIHDMYVKHLPESQRPHSSNAATRNNSVS